MSTQHNLLPEVALVRQEHVQREGRGSGKEPGVELAGRDLAAGRAVDLMRAQVVLPVFGVVSSPVNIIRD